MANAVAGAWAEQVPLLLLSGAPGVAERKGEPLLHHRVKDFDTQLRVFSDLTVIQRVLDNPHTAADHIDAVISRMISDQRPGYIEVPRDMVGVAIAPPSGDLEISLPPLDSESLAAAVEDDLAFGFVHEAVARGNADRLIGCVHVEPQGLAHGQRFGERDKVCGAQEVRHNLELRGRTPIARVQHATAECGEHRKHAFKAFARAGGKNRDIAGIGAVAAARNRAFHEEAAAGFDQRAEAQDFCIYGVY
jgi:tRNA-binding EMAP/Myf-like protein